MYLDRSEDTTAKSSRQLLFALSSSLTKWPDQAQARVLCDRTVTSFISVLSEPHVTARLKAALQGLEHFINRGIVSIEDLVKRLRMFELRDDSVSITDTGITEGTRSPDTTDFGLAVSTTHKDVAPQEVDLDPFIMRLLFWVSNTDIARAACRLISSFFGALGKRVAGGSNNFRPAGQLPRWVPPLKKHLLKYPESLRVLKHHLLPELISSNHDDLVSLSNSLSLDSLLSGGSSDTIETDLILLLSCLQIGQDLGLVQVGGRLIHARAIASKPYILTNCPR